MDNMLNPTNDGERFELHDPTVMPRASGFLWNRKMVVQVNCRGYAIAQYMHPDASKYTRAPNQEAKTFMQPEQSYFSHHPGRFFYIKDEETGSLFSAPYEPVKAQLDSYCFSVGKSDIAWTVEKDGIRVEMNVGLAVDDFVELWKVKVSNVSGRPRKISVYPYVPVGYMSWMNQGAAYRADLGGVVASCVTPYQKVADYFKNRDLKDKTYFLHDRTPDAYEANRETFEGEGGLPYPDGIRQETLGNGDACFETLACVLQYRLGLAADKSESYRFLLGPALDDAEILSKRTRYFGASGFEKAADDYAAYIAEGKGVLMIATPDAPLDNFANNWLPRQIFYHGDVNRLTSDPQTRNYIQDAMGMSYIKPEATRAAFLHALTQQEKSGAMPDGILLRRGAELMFINQIPHTDHCVWLPVCLRAYLDESADYGILNEMVADEKDGEAVSVFDRITRAMNWLLLSRDERGLSYINQGDWCDPMNMVGYKGKGVSGWLSVATAYALKVWAGICAHEGRSALAAEFLSGAGSVNDSVNTHMWDGRWYGRGITDDGVLFGIAKDVEGRIFLNPQSWAILAGAADAEKRASMMKAIEEQLETPYGPMMLAPCYTAMREDVGRVTQKYPGSAENGSVYNHAAVFYIYSLYTIREADRAYRLLSAMIGGPGDDDYIRRGQMPVYIPNYYRGAYYQIPRTAGRSSQLFNTGTVSWVYRCLIECLFGLKGCDGGLLVEPQLPSHWTTAKAGRSFRGAVFSVSYRREKGADSRQVLVDGVLLPTPWIGNVVKGKKYSVEVILPL
jgi:cellobionic acid phosphorylase